MEYITYEEACYLLDYDSTTGVITWKQKRRPNIYPGKTAGCKSVAHGYVQICINGRMYGAHRIAWLIAYGEFPRCQIDHLNGIRHDNRLANLRDVDNTTNQENQRLPRKDSTTGLKGVSPNGDGFRASIRVDGIRKLLGTYKTAIEAHKVYIMAKREFHKGNTL